MYNLHLTRTNRANIRKMVFDKIGSEEVLFTKPRSRFRISAVAACIVIALAAGTFGAFAAGIIVPSEIHRAFFGDGAEYIGFNIDAVSENAGIEMRLVSAVSDGKSVYAFIDMTDTQERLDEKLQFDPPITAENESLFDGWLGLDALHILNANANEASFVVKLFANQNISVGSTLSVNIPEFQTGYEYHSFDTGVNLYASAVMDAKSAFDYANEFTGYTYSKDSDYANIKHEELGKTVPLLIKDEMAIPIDGVDWAVISNMGFVDGKLHIQTRYTMDYQYGTTSLELLDKDGVEIPYALQTGGQTYAGAHAEFIYDIDREALKNCTLNMWRAVVNDIVEGPWRLQFEVESEVSRFPLTAKDMSFTVSSIGIEIKISRNSERYAAILNADNYILLDDGTRIPLKLDRGEIVNDTGNGTLCFVNSYYDIEKFSAAVFAGVEYRK